MSDILISGGTGEIGSVLVERLSRDARVRVLGRNYEKSERVRNLVARNAIDFIACDIADKESLSRVSALPGVTRLIHLAASVKDSHDVLRDCRGLIETNVLGMTGLLGLLPDLEELYFASTCAVYGLPSGSAVTEAHQTRPEGLYGLSKLIAENTARLYCEDRKIGLSVLRISSVFSPSTLNFNARRAVNIFSECIRKGTPITINGDGNNRGDFIYVKDVVDGVQWALGGRKFGVYNISSGTPRSVNEIADLLMRVADKRVDVIHKPSSTHAPDYCYDNSKARREGFSPACDFEAALREVYFEA
jgi:UDP-glucose 4-epimerase